ncbi:MULTISPECIES: hypothetical protein [unclassified Sphingomonas]|uniref:hypothetical protein n=1 Tax=unclassified Sphingomonas TaxID=196159 RepID=UPI001F5A6BB1|nr:MULTISPECIES: hypothetical protein [unclassified Sphingomonas]
MIGAALLILAQTAPAAAAPERFSILVDPCASANDDKGKDIVVCGRTDAITPRLPLRDFRGPPDHAVPSNPDLKASVALDGPSARGECGAYGEACPVAMGGYVLPAIIGGAVDGVKRAFAKHPDKTGRVPIDLGDPPPIPANALQP